MNGRFGRLRTLAVGLTAVLSAALLPVSARAQPADSSFVSQSLSELHRLINVHRREVGCEDLKWHQATAEVAEAHSADMSRRNYFDHLTPEGADLSARLLAGGVTWHGSIAENIALTVRGPDVVMQLWLDSPPHRANIEDCAFTHHGLGLYRDRWTQVLVEHPDG